MNFRRLLSLIRKEFIQIVRDPRTLAITFAMPVRADLPARLRGHQRRPQRAAGRVGSGSFPRLPASCWMHTGRPTISTWISTWTVKPSCAD